MEKHGMSGTLAYRTWVDMKGRCQNPKHPKFYMYGARGITVCPRWKTSFLAFLEDMGERPPGTSIDRIDGERGYEPGNCRWATPKEQSSHTRNCVMVTYLGETHCIQEWARRFGLTRSTAQYRITTLGLPPEVAFTLPDQRGRWKRVEGKGRVLHPKTT